MSLWPLQQRWRYAWHFHMVCSLRIAISTSAWYSNKAKTQMEEENTSFPKDRFFSKRHQKNGNHFINTSCDEVGIKWFAARKGKLREWSQMFNRDYRIYYNIRPNIFAFVANTGMLWRYVKYRNTCRLYKTFWNGLDSKFKVLSSIEDFKESIRS